MGEYSGLGVFLVWLGGTISGIGIGMFIERKLRSRIARIGQVEGE